MTTAAAQCCPRCGGLLVREEGDRACMTCGCRVYDRIPTLDVLGKGARLPRGGRHLKAVD